MPNQKYYISKLNSEFKKRVQKNPSYSIRSYARDLKIDSSSLSSIMNGKRKIPKAKIDSFASALCNQSEIAQFIASAGKDHVTLKTIKSKNKYEERHPVTEEEFATISCVQTYTLLSLLELDNFKYDTGWIAKKLKLDVAEVEQKIASLLQVGLITEAGGTLKRTKMRTTTTDEIASKYIAKHHLDSLDLAKDKCVELHPGERYFSTVTIPCDPESIEHVKKLIMEFEDKIEAYLSPLKKTDVFKLSIQFYQATEKV